MEAETLFLFSDVPLGDGQQLVHNITQDGYPVLAFVANFEDIANLFYKFPDVTWIVLDVNRSPDTVTKIFKILPIPNYIVNFNGTSFSQCVLGTLQSKGITYKERERGHSEMALEDIADEDDEEECIIVNVVTNRSELKKTSKTISKRFGKLVRGAKKKISTTFTQDDDDDEAAPLINRNQESTSEESIQNFLLNLFYQCCPCFAEFREPEYKFQNMEELQIQMQTEQLIEIHNSLKKLHLAEIATWDVTLLELRRKESQKIEELAAKRDEMRQQEEQDLSKVKDAQNANTQHRLSNVLSAETIKRIEESRSRQTRGTAKYDSDKKFQEGKSLITKQIAIDKAQFRERHYFNLVEMQIEKLTSIQRKFQKKTATLKERYFKN